MGDKSFFNFNRNSELNAFTMWLLMNGENIDRVKQLPCDRHGHYLFGLYEGVEKRGLVKIFNDQIQVRQPMIEALKELFPEIKINVRKLT
jgi:hypothetical protein